jgi:UDP-N-acetylmuramyl pentapeptide phosphotransferase/UDP-N-acetylglucosamine-1-phosphate transferase
MASRPPRPPSSLAVASIRWDGGIEVPALSLVGAALAFAPFNAANRVFLGDVGSYLLGASLSMLAVVGVLQGIPVLAAVLPFGLYVADVVFTLARRLARHAPLMQSHREHVYQRLANERGWGHARTTAAVSMCTLALALLANLGGAAEVGVGRATWWLLSAGVVMAYLQLPWRADRVRA